MPSSYAQKTCNSRLWWIQPLIQWCCRKLTGPVFFWVMCGLTQSEAGSIVAAA